MGLFYKAHYGMLWVGIADPYGSQSMALIRANISLAKAPQATNRPRPWLRISRPLVKSFSSKMVSKGCFVD